ncbi:hypothetical protein CC1G_14754 [Coprinopsis cinerea okayama7|uniref:Uncharacterized protein n=1 Tax=Coprinopsis cinerea (strain Okayama-7 / 130 / ATCC MYA-4618 / FGSC 9003) TaxID=240176 RepID=D6RNL7_COPC7|nr:hypothetical protein CC1G_14754 [Coprinopsis cinerea okayama7\|eukprot:XP_002910776.1 hypothetical protein CC1G_14754 [Coprinopsis cinerea okayama7\
MSENAYNASEPVLNEDPQGDDVGSLAPSVVLPRPRSKNTAGKAPYYLKPSRKTKFIHRSSFPKLEHRRRDRQLAARAAGYAAIARTKYRSVVSRLQQLSNTFFDIDDVLNDDDRDNTDKLNHISMLIQNELGADCIWDSGDSDCASLGGIPSDSE